MYSDRRSTVLFVVGWLASISSVILLQTTSRSSNFAISNFLLLFFFCYTLDFFIGLYLYSYWEFFSYAYTGRPVVVKDALVNWTAKDTFTYDFFGRLYDTYGSAERSDRCQFFPYKTEFHSLRQALSMSKERMDKPWYFGW